MIFAQKNRILIESCPLKRAIQVQYLRAQSCGTPRFVSTDSGLWTKKGGKMIRKLLTGTAIASVLLATTSCSKRHEEGKQQQAPAPTLAAPASNARGNPPTDRRELLQEAVSALQETNNALIAIDQNKRRDAIAALERATGKLEIVLARTPTLALAPVDVTASTHDLLADPKDVDALRDDAERAIEHGRLQDARHLIDGLSSETVLSVSSLPLATYPTAIKSAATLLTAGKTMEAKAVLQTALNTIVVQDTIIPLPIARAEAAIEQAKGLSAKANRTAADNARLHGLLATAREQLRFGKALGYATDKDLDDLLNAIDELEAKTSGQKFGSGLLDHLKSLFAQAREASQTGRKP
jgi:hypothetical protein